MFKGLSLKQTERILLEGESPTLNISATTFLNCFDCVI